MRPPARKHAAASAAAVCMCVAAVCLFGGSNNHNSSININGNGVRTTRNLKSETLQADPTKFVTIAPPRPPFFVPSLEDISYCTAKNDVLTRGDRHDDETNLFAQDVKSMGRRIYSMSYADFVPKHSRQCETVRDMTDAIRDGRRVWDPSLGPDELSSTYRQLLPSIFVPDRCDLLALSPHTACDVLSEFSDVFMHGDSMMRHVRAGLLMTLTNNLILGGMVAHEPEERQRTCKCDGQFSESGICRKGQDVDESPQLKPFMSGVCPNVDAGQVPSVVMSDRFGIPDAFSNADVACNDDSYKGLLVLVNGGLHYHVDAETTFINFIRPLLESIKTCAARGKVTFIWNSMGVQAEVLDSKWTMQTKSNAVKFNSEMEDIFRREGVQGVITVDWVNFTNEAQSSDGVHHLSQVNYFKAQYLLRIAKQARVENLVLKLPDKESDNMPFQKSIN